MPLHASLRQRFADLRAREFPRLELNHQVYLDHTGSALYPDSLVRRHAELLRGCLLGNPHSENPASRTSTEHIAAARAAVLDHFDADPEEHTVCFTANATAAVKLVAESFPFHPGSRLLLTADNHNSVNGIRAFAARAGAGIEYLPIAPDLRLPEPLPPLPPASEEAASLFAFPAQSNFSGVRHPLTLVRAARERGYLVLLDAAAFVPTHSLSLTECPADFVAISLYKMFGYPTGVGALVARRDALRKLKRPWFAGGAVAFVSVAAGLHLQSPGEAGFEDGTPDFLSLAAIPAGLGFLREIGLEEIGTYLHALTERLLAGLTTLRHPGGAPLVQLYGPDSAEDRGATVAFNLRDPGGAIIPCETVVAAAAAEGISLRGGCFCNPGAAEAAFGYEPTALRGCLETLMNDFTLERFSACIGAPAGAVRASLGISSSEEDVDRLLHLLDGFTLDPSATQPFSTTRAQPDSPSSVLSVPPP